MILADKISELRKKNKWSQEELASKLGVSRQAISKWESAQSIPDLERILAMSKLFSVSTDTLIKDELDLTAEPMIDAPESEEGFRVLTFEEAGDYLRLKEKSARPIAFGVMLLILAVIPTVLADSFHNEEVASTLGAILVILIVLVGLAFILFNSLPLGEFQWMEKAPFDTAYGVRGMVKEKQKALQPKFITHIVAAVSLILLAMATWTAGDLAESVFKMPEEYLLSLGFAFVALAMYLFVTVGIPHGAYQLLLQEDDFSPKKRIFNRKMAYIAGIYWLLTTALYLGYSFLTMNWERSWIIWPVAGVLFGVVTIVMNLKYEQEEDPFKK